MAGDADELGGVAREAGGSWISPGAVALDDPALAFARGALVANPDGHALRVREDR
jgi:hypothetical protein